jgi:hypothetical protein
MNASLPLSLTRLLLLLGLCATATASMAFVRFDMPAGGTSWVELQANSCDGDCVGDARAFSGAYLVPKAGFNYVPISATGRVAPDGMLLSHSAASVGGFTGHWAATGGLFVLHGDASTTPLTVTARIAADGEFRQGHTTTFASGGVDIGGWNDQPTPSDINFRVGPTVSQDFTTCNFNACQAGTRPWALQAEHALQVRPGDPFNLGFRAYLSLGPTALGTVAGDIVAHVQFDLPAGYNLTGSNGYDSRVSSVPEPAGVVLLLAGLALLALRRARSRRSRP